MKQFFRRSGLRGRLLIALVATSALTLAVAAAALLPPLQDRLRTQRADDLEAATITDAVNFEDKLRSTPPASSPSTSSCSTSRSGRGRRGTTSPACSAGGATSSRSSC